MVPTGNKAKRLSFVNHTTKTIHHHHETPLLSPPYIFLHRFVDTGIFCATGQTFR